MKERDVFLLFILICLVRKIKFRVVEMKLIQSHGVLEYTTMVSIILISTAQPDPVDFPAFSPSVVFLAVFLQEVLHMAIYWDWSNRSK